MKIKSLGGDEAMGNDTTSATTNKSSSADKKNESRDHGCPQLLENENRATLSDKYFSSSVSDHDFQYTVFVRLNAVSTFKNPLRFEKVKFRHCIFEGCYLRDCVFDSCDFTGCRFVNCNFHGSKFNGCNFEYAIFEKTQIDAEILECEAPLKENLKMRFARTLRVNFQQLGDAEAVNKAISVELEATEQHLYKSWASKESYYRRKYPGVSKIHRFLSWLKFRGLDILWGNGESLTKLVRTLIFSITGIGIFDTIFFHNPYVLGDYAKSLLLAPAIFFGVSVQSAYPPIYSSAIAVTRLILLALFTAILVKRFNRR